VGSPTPIVQWTKHFYKAEVPSQVNRATVVLMLLPSACADRSWPSLQSNHLVA